MTWTFIYLFFIIFLNGCVTALRHFLTSYYADLYKFLEKFCWVIGMTFSSHRQDSNLLLQKSWHVIKKILEIPARKSFNSLNQRTLPVPFNQLFWKSRDVDERRFVYVVRFDPWYCLMGQWVRGVQWHSSHLCVDVEAFYLSSLWATSTCKPAEGGQVWWKCLMRESLDLTKPELLQKG